MNQDIKINYKSHIFILIIVIINSLVLNAATIRSAKSGYWFSNDTWVGGVIPNELDDVVISDKDTIHIFEVQSTDFSLKLCRNLTVNPLAMLSIGHNNASNNSSINVSGNLICDGVIWRGNTIGTSSLNEFNSLFVFDVDKNNVLITGRGYFGPESIQFNVTGEKRQIRISHYYIVTDSDFYINSDFPVELEIERPSYIYVRQNFGLTGKTYETMQSTTAVNCVIKGIVVADNVWLLNPPESKNLTSLNIHSYGSLTTNMFNKGSNEKNSGLGFKVIVYEQGTLRSSYGCNDPKNLAAQDQNLEIVENVGANVVGWNTIKFPTASSLQAAIKPYLPMNSTSIESDFSNVYSASHIAGWYHLTNKPYLIEGKDALKELGSTHIKLSMGTQNNKLFSNYPFNHNWPAYTKLIDIAKDPNWDNVFSDSHYEKYTFWATTRSLNDGQYKSGAHINLPLYWAEEEEFYQLAKHLLITYPNKEFVFQNWEGDWMLRGSGVKWESDPSLIPLDLETKLEGMRRMFHAQQRGIERARQENWGSSRVMHAIEINKLFAYKDSKYQTMMELNVPCLLSDVVTHCRSDLVSWSAYDGIFGKISNDFPIGLAKGIEVIESYINPTGYCNKLPVQIGEIAFDENGWYKYTDTRLKDHHEKLAGLARYKNIQAYFLWNLYCTGAQGITLERGKEYDPKWLTPYLDGKWVIKPNGDYGISGQKFISFKNKLDTETGYKNLKSNINIVLSDGILNIPEELSNITFEIINMNGVVIKKFSGVSKVDLTYFQKGIYILHAKDYTLQSKKIIVN